MVFRSHGPIFGCIDHGYSSTRPARPAGSEAWDTQTGPVKFGMGSPNALALAFRSNTVCACAETKSRAFPTARFLAAVGATRSQLTGPAPLATCPSGLLRRGVAFSPTVRLGLHAVEG